jgi:hypothetical protein
MSEQATEKWWQAKDLQWVWRRFARALFVIAVGLVAYLIVLVQEWWAGIR